MATFRPCPNPPLVLVLTPSSRLWFSTTITGLYGLYVNSYKDRDPEEERKDDWKRVKYLCDLTFVCEYGRHSAASHACGLSTRADP